MDYDVFKSINDFTSRHDGIEDFFSFVAQNSHYIFVAFLVVLFLLPQRWGSPNLRRGVVAAVVAAGVGLFVSGHKSWRGRLADWDARWLRRCNPFRRASRRA